MKKLILLCSLLCGAAQAARHFNGTSTDWAGGTGTTCGACSSQITISFWLYVDSFGQTDAVAIENGSTSIGFNSETGDFIVDTGTGSVIGACPKGTFYVGANTVNGRLYHSMGFSQPSSATWHHYAFLIDMVTYTNWKAYVDGVQQTTTTCDTDTTSSSLSSKKIYFMSRFGSSLFLKGSLANVAFWDVLLNAHEIAALANCVPGFLMRREKITWPYAPFYGVDSPEPSYTGTNVPGSGGSTNPTIPIHGTTTVAGPPGCDMDPEF